MVIKVQDSNLHVEHLGVHLLDRQYVDFESFEEHHFFLVIMRGELRPIYPESIEPGPVSDGDEKEYGDTIVHLNWRLRKGHRIFEVLCKTRVLRQVYAVRLIWVEFVLLSN